MASLPGKVRQLMYFVSTLLLCLALITTQDASAAPTCHCFQQRSFSANDPAAVEPYLLATTNNSLLAVAFNIPKRSIVKDKMGGARDADLWVGYGLAPAYPLEAQVLIDKKLAFKSWSLFVRSQRPDPERVPAAVMSGLAAGKSDGILADIAMAQTLSTLFELPVPTSMNLLEDGLSRQQLALALLLARIEETAIEKIVAMATAEQGGWAKLTEALGLAPDNMEALWLMLVDKAKAASGGCLCDRERAVSSPRAGCGGRKKRRSLPRSTRG